MASPSCERVELAGAGAATDYARGLLADVGVAVTARPGPRDPHPALAWAASGAMALTGEPDALPRVPRGALASCADGVARALAALGCAAPRDPAALLGERAARFGFTRRGRVAPGGATRLLRAADGWAALSLAREEDRRALPAWLELAATNEDAWALAQREVARRSLAELALRARWLGLAFAPATTAPPPTRAGCARTRADRAAIRRAAHRACSTSPRSGPDRCARRCSPTRAPT
jgi:hypothetical protein